MVMPDRLMINQCFYHFKSLYKNLEKKAGGGGALKENMITNGNVEDSPAKVITKADPQQEQEIQRLNMLVKQRDNEIGILLNYLNKKKEQGAVTMLPNGGDVKV